MNTHLEFQCSIETAAEPQFAWQFWTNIDHWRELEPGVEFELHGPFAPGASGCTIVPGQEPRHWSIRSVDPGRSWTQEIALPRASLTVSMQFEELPERRTRITQRFWLEGDGAEAFLDGVRMFETTTPDGLKRIGAAIEAAHRNVSRSGTATQDGRAAMSHSEALSRLSVQTGEAKC